MIGSIKFGIEWAKKAEKKLRDCQVIMRKKNNNFGTIIIKHHIETIITGYSLQLKTK